MRSISKAVSTSTCENSSIHLNFTRLYTRITYSMVYKTIPRFWVTVEFGLIPQNLTHILDLKKTLILRCISIGITMRKNLTNEGKKSSKLLLTTLVLCGFVLFNCIICVRNCPLKNYPTLYLLQNSIQYHCYIFIERVCIGRHCGFCIPYRRTVNSVNNFFACSLWSGVFSFSFSFFLPFLYTLVCLEIALYGCLFFKFCTYSYIIWW